MKVLDLCCAADHAFEGWFGSEADFVDQLDRSLIACPVCGSVEIQRRPSAPRLNLSSAREPRRSTAPEAAAETLPQQPPQAPAALPAPTRPMTPEAAAHAAVMQAAYLHAMRELMARTEDVGPRFAEEARRIHYGESKARQIRGKTSAADAEALREEGIEFFSLPVPTGLDGPLQ